MAQKLMNGEIMRKSNTLPIIRDVLSIVLLASISLSLAALSRIRPGKAL